MGKDGLRSLRGNSSVRMEHPQATIHGRTFQVERHTIDRLSKLEKYRRNGALFLRERNARLSDLSKIDSQVPRFDEFVQRLYPHDARRTASPAMVLLPAFPFDNDTAGLAVVAIPVSVIHHALELGDYGAGDMPGVVVKRAWLWLWGQRSWLRFGNCNLQLALVRFHSVPFLWVIPLASLPAVNFS